MSTQLIAQLIGLIKKEKEGMAEAAMLFPKPLPFEHGMQAGKYQGLERALEILESLLRDDLEKEIRS